MSRLEGKISLIDKWEKGDIRCATAIRYCYTKDKDGKIVDLPPLLLLLPYILPIALTSL
jgi:hypothetical protein